MSENLLSIGFIVSETLLLFLSAKYKIARLFVFIILIIVGLFFLTKHFDKNIFLVSNTELTQIDQRRPFYAEGFGKFYKNRFGIFYFENLRIYFGKISNNFFSMLDLSSFFSQQTNNQEKYPLFLAPFFVLGILLLLLDSKKTPIIYLIIILLVNSFTNLNTKQRSLLMFPLINLCIVIGVLELKKFGRRMLRKVNEK